ncbi:rhodopsin [Phormidesmis priestleyi ULC007]|uniref:Rhodopsin n=1 Tax=Phormidesmis priestleyi ULC007 TaxID=1920490 RepID=A0A2T1DCP3_9CYAN|nr:microbial rhodopsin family protein [Phormidesmis priestleyi]PSB18237.1 rhodopsin [Phormidesmis priestleyi ULC007]PZO49508.1 MAG: rhodopsin [Phormidesmis priestleyi]
MTQNWLLIGCVGMTLGAIAFGFGANNAKNEAWRIVYTINFFIAAIAAGLYLAMVLGQGFNVIYSRPTYWVRYVTWSLSTPLTLVLLSFLGGTSLPIAAGMVGADIYMIATGFVATISPKPTSYIWYFVSCGAYLGLVYLLLHHYRKEAAQQHPRGKKVFGKLLTVHLVLWTAYPIVWMLAKTGYSVIDSSAETMSYTLLDLAAKVGFGFLSLNSLRQLEQTSEVPQHVQERVLR